MCDPLTPTLLSKPVLFYLSFCTNYWFVSYEPIINEIALAFWAADYIWAIVAYVLLYLILSAKDPLNSTGSWDTTPKQLHK